MMGIRTGGAVCLLILVLAQAAPAAVSGRALDSVTQQPIAGVQIRVQADPASLVATTNALGEYTLNVSGLAGRRIGAARPYSHAVGADNYATEHLEVSFDGETDLNFLLEKLAPSRGFPPTPYTPAGAQTCSFCHTDQHAQWQSSRHANAANNVWMLDMFSGSGTPGGAAGYIFTATHASGDTGFCATCHAPMQDIFTPGMLKVDMVSTTAGNDSVSCLACHQIVDVDTNQINGLHYLGGKVDYYFSQASNVDFNVNGPLPDVVTGTMRNIYNPLFRDSLLCAACHQYTNPNNGAPGQNTYQEWLASPYAQPGTAFRSCMDCHMPPADGEGQIASTSDVIRPAEQIRNHGIVGATPQSLAGAIFLSATARVEGNEFVVTAEVENRGAGHSFPTGFSIRNALLWIEASHNGTPLMQSAGPTLPGWASDDVPGVQSGDLAGRPGSGFAKVLRGRINGQGSPVEPVIFIDAETVAEDSTLASGSTRTVEVRFTIPGGANPAQLNFDAQLLWRRAFRALAVTKGWTTSASGGPIEILVSRRQGVNGVLLRDGFE